MTARDVEERLCANPAGVRGACPDFICSLRTSSKVNNQGGESSCNHSVIAASTSSCPCAPRACHRRTTSAKSTVHAELGLEINISRLNAYGTCSSVRSRSGKVLRIAVATAAVLLCREQNRRNHIERLSSANFSAEVIAFRTMRRSANNGRLACDNASGFNFTAHSMNSRSALRMPLTRSRNSNTLVSDEQSPNGTNSHQKSVDVKRVSRLQLHDRRLHPAHLEHNPSQGVHAEVLLHAKFSLGVQGSEDRFER
eukprot:CAMPEP_0115596944 /NCGR_PEP_ID=MMETSP0272-20121206/13095_1 /TAXON_ID=71861 /ORGANISM="Scrippsiella trochoidea, Strain CCMP3099" /LENGTH=253 /DNA_ID=CAMNT_0003032295 /DNA_START=112 /DNA_END=873 /DNA_ORIENTATION=-